MKKNKYVKSLAMLERAYEVIPGASQTFSKGPTQYVLGSSPAFISHGKGSHVWDVDGNEFIDAILGLGPVTLGYGYDRVDDAVIGQLRQGAVFSQPHSLEVELAEIITDLIPCAEMVRYAKNGSDVTTAAVRIARAYTGKDIVACCGYHGWHDWYIATTSRKLGIPEAVCNLTKTFLYNNIESLERLFSEYPNEIACVILEPVGIEEPQEHFLQKVKELTHKNGAILIFDEIVTGFRVNIKGAQKQYGVIPDLATFGKGCANGYPLSFVAGKKDIMNIVNSIFFSFTFGGEVISLRAAIETIKEFQKKNVVEYMWRVGRKAQDSFNKSVKQHGLEDYIAAVGLPCHFVYKYSTSKNIDSLLIRSLLCQEMIERGILTIGSNNFCYEHKDKDIDEMISATDKSLEIVSRAIREGCVEKYVKGEPVKPVFRKP